MIPKRNKASDASRADFHLQRLPVTAEELAEDAGHMGFSRDYHPGSEAYRQKHDHTREIEEAFDLASKD